MVTDLPDLLRDEVLHVIARGGQLGWHGIATRLSSKDVPRAPELPEVLTRLREQGLVAEHEGDGGTRQWSITDAGARVLAERRSPPRSRELVRRSERIAELLYYEPGHPPDIELLRIPEQGPTPDEIAWLRILVEDARFALEPPKPSRSRPRAAISPDVAELPRRRDEAERNGDWRRFIESIRNATELPPAIGLYFRGRAWQGMGFLTLAAALYERALWLDPSAHHIRTVRLNTLVDARDWERLTSAVDEIRDDASCPLEVALTAEVVTYRSFLAQPEPPSVDRYRHIAERCAELLSKRSDHTVSSVAASGAVTAALCFDAAGNRSRARHYAALATSLSPDSGPARLVRGLVYHRAASPKAGEHLRLAAERLPHLVWPRLYLAHLAVIEERYDDCIRWADEGLSRDASDAVRAALHEWRGISRAALQDHDGAASDLDAAIALAPAESRYRANRTAFREATGRPTYALEVPESLYSQAARALGAESLDRAA